MLKVSRNLRRQGGASLLEVLVSMLLLSMGMLSMGAMHARAAQAMRVGQHLAIASQLAMDLGERVRANAAAARQGAYDVQAGDGLAASASATQCLSSVCSATELASQDVAQWSRSALEQMPGVGAVTRYDDEGGVPAMNIWMVWREASVVSVKPDDEGAPAAPAASRRCPAGLQDGVDDPARCLHLKVSL